MSSVLDSIRTHMDRAANRLGPGGYYDEEIKIARDALERLEDERDSEAVRNDEWQRILSLVEQFGIS